MKSSFLKTSMIACVVCSFAIAEGTFIGYEGGYSFASNWKEKTTDGESGSVKKGQFNSGVKANRRR